MIRYRLVLSALFLSLAAAAIGGRGQVAGAEVPDLPGWRLTWHEEFDGPKIDTQVWDVANVKNSHNNEKQYYRSEQAALVDGKLRITATNEPLDGKMYRSARLSSNQAFPLGRFEARIDLPTTQGMWPAFWLLPRGAQWPTAGEIDIMENKGSHPNVVSSAYHWQTNPGPCCDDHQYVVQKYSAEENGAPVDYHMGFHVYAVEWEAKKLRFYVDGTLHYTVDELADRPIFEQPMNIILNLAVGGDFGGDPDSSTAFPQVMDVDYVRVWERSPGLSSDRSSERRVKLATRTERARSVFPFGFGRQADRNLPDRNVVADKAGLPTQR